MARVRRWCRGRVPEQFRDEVRVAGDVADRHLTVVECRPPWREDFGPDWTRFQIARLRYVKVTGLWPLFWRDRRPSIGSPSGPLTDQGGPKSSAVTRLTRSDP